MRIRAGMRWPRASWVWAGMTAGTRNGGLSAGFGVRNGGSSGEVRFGRNGGSSEWVRVWINAWMRAGVGALCKENMLAINLIK